MHLQPHICMYRSVVNLLHRLSSLYTFIIREIKLKKKILLLFFKKKKKMRIYFIFTNNKIKQNKTILLYQKTSMNCCPFTWQDLHNSRTWRNVNDNLEIELMHQEKILFIHFYTYQILIRSCFVNK